MEGGPWGKKIRRARGQGRPAQGKAKATGLSFQSSNVCVAPMSVTMGWAQHSAAIPAPQEQRTGLEKKMELVRCCYVAMLLFHGPMRRLGGFIVAGRWVLLCSLAMGFFLSALGMLGGLLSLSILGRGEGVGVPRRS